MKAVANILKSKPDPTVYTIAPDASVFDALKLMAEKSIGALVVTKGEQVVGILLSAATREKSSLWHGRQKNFRPRYHDLVGAVRAP